MNRAQLRALIASLGLSGLLAGGVWLAKDDATPATKPMPTGDQWFVLYRPQPQSMGPDICDGSLDCDAPAAGLESALCLTRGAGYVREAGGDRYVDGFWRDLVILPYLDDPDRCLVKVRSSRAQMAMLKQITPGSDHDQALKDAAQEITTTPGFNQPYSTLPAVIRDTANSQRWAGHRVEDTRDQDDDGVPIGSLDGGA